MLPMTAFDVAGSTNGTNGNSTNGTNGLNSTSTGGSAGTGISGSSSSDSSSSSSGGGGGHGGVGSMGSFGKVRSIEALQTLVPPPNMIRLGTIILLWYACSSLTNNIGKNIFNHFRYPITLTVAQFGFVALFAFLYSRMGVTLTDGSRATIQPLSRNIFQAVGPLAIFNIIGHVLSAVSISRVSVSLAHTIKALSPLFTVILSSIFINTSYTIQVYISLIPLMLGVILACVSDITFETTGLMAALASSLVFVVQNLFSKKVFTDKWMDELNLLFYSAITSFFLMLPLWLYYDGLELSMLGWKPLTAEIMILLLCNGITHFGQNIFAFSFMTLVSPVTYSVASLMKRVFIIIMAIIYFSQEVTIVNVVGLMLTFMGLHMYNQAKEHPSDVSTSRTNGNLHSDSDMSMMPGHQFSHHGASLPRFYSSTSANEMLLPPLSYNGRS